MKIKIKNKYLLHFITIWKHKLYVGKYLFKKHLYWQAIAHDFSKFSLIEFFSSAKYFNGNKSPIEIKRAEKGYSEAWLHHKGRNKHHWMYWIDFKKGEIVKCRIPKKYLIEMTADLIGASKAYLKTKYDKKEPLIYFEKESLTWLMDEEDKNFVLKLLKEEAYENQD